MRMKQKGIVRIDDPAGHGVGWYARVTYKGVTWSKYFADGTHGGKSRAFQKALDWRNEKEVEVGKPRTDRIIPPVSSRNRTGISGVYRSKNHFVVAWSPATGDTRREFISIAKYGEEGALRRAVELRRRREREVYGKSVSSMSHARWSGLRAPAAKKPAPKARRKAVKRTARPAARRRAKR